MAALEQILISAVERNVTVLVYVPPLRSDVSRPYDPVEYTEFIADVSTLADANDAIFSDLEDIVPGPLWGTTGSSGLGSGMQYDFMHFQGAGHVLLASALLSILEELGYGL